MPPDRLQNGGISIGIEYLEQSSPMPARWLQISRSITPGEVPSSRHYIIFIETNIALPSAISLLLESQGMP